LSGADILVSEENLKPLEEGRYYSSELVGCSVFTKTHETVGIVKDVWTIGESVLLVVERDRNGKEILIPFSEAICPEVDRARKTIVIDPPDGLLDLNEI
jgi:16S rRNA processing protein RimM